MAEGWTRHLWPDLFYVQSAGVTAQGLNEHAVKVMAEKGVDISRHRSKTLEALPSLSYDFVITVCSQADEACPVFSALTRRLHQGFDNPLRLAMTAKSSEEALAHYRRVRDEIGAFVTQLPQYLQTQETTHE